jgi:subtilisin family serine protease
MRRSLLVFTAALVLGVPSVAHAAAGDIIVQREPGLDGSERRELRRDAGVELVKTLPLTRTELVQPAAGELAQALATLRASGDVVYAEPDRPATLSTARNDFFWNSLWGLENTGQSGGTVDADIDATEAWQRSEGAGVTVAVVDTGVNATHQDLAGQLAGNPGEQGDGRETNGIDDDHNGFVDDAAGWDFYARDNVPEDGNGHGTHVTGTIAALGTNRAGVVGVAPRAKVLPLRVLGNGGSGWMSDIATAFDYAGDLGVPIVNASLGGPRTEVVEQAIAEHPGTLYVVAAGNDNTNADTSYPCALELANVVCVGAGDNHDERASFSNYSAASVDLFAPGVDIVSTYNTSSSAYVAMDGTSMATPHVAGAAALALAASPGASTAHLRWALLSSVDAKPALSGLAATGGRLNADAAITAVLSAEPEPVAPPAPTAPPTPSPEPPAVAPPVVTPPPAAVVTPVPTALVHLKVGGSLRTPKSRLSVTFSLNRAATVRFTVTRRGSRKPLAGWTSHGRAGANRVVLTRRLPTRRTLAPGSYRLAVGLDQAAKSSAVVRVR